MNNKTVHLVNFWWKIPITNSWQSIKYIIKGTSISFCNDGMGLDNEGSTRCEPWADNIITWRNFQIGVLPPPFYTAVICIGWRREDEDYFKKSSLIESRVENAAKCCEGLYSSGWGGRSNNLSPRKAGCRAGVGAVVLLSGGGGWRLENTLRHCVVVVSWPWNRAGQLI